METQSSATRCHGQSGRAQPYGVLVIDDDPAVVELTLASLAGLPVQVIGAVEAEQGLRLVESERPQLVLLDLVLPDVSGMELLPRIRESDPRIDVVLVTANYSVESAVEAIQKGAYDYLTKPCPVARLRGLVERWIAGKERQQREMAVDEELLSVYRFGGVIGRSPLMLELFSQIQRFAPHYRTALIRGATGTGKELIARQLHHASPVKNGAFLACNCAAVSETLFESEFFGYAKGAFTGAMENRAGLIEAASGGVLFLDEVSELPLSSQSKLLRFLQSWEVRRIGSTQVRHVQVRVVAATNRDLREMVEAKTFREDLYYRLAIVELKIPPLADRRDDIPLLVSHFLAVCRKLYGKPKLKITNRALAALLNYSWPGNVRELENLISSRAMLTTDETIDINLLPDRILTPAGRSPVPGVDLITLDEVRGRHIDGVLKAVHGNLQEAARILGIGRTTLYRLLRRHRAMAAAAN